MLTGALFTGHCTQKKMKTKRRTMKDIEGNATVEELDLLYLEKRILIQLPKLGCLGKLEMPCVSRSICRGQADMREVEARQDC